MVEGNRIVVKRGACIQDCFHCVLEISVVKTTIDYNGVLVFMGPYLSCGYCYEGFVDIISIVNYRRFV